MVAKYGTAQNWADAQLERMHDWGYNTLGAWSDLDLFAGRSPYTVLLDMTSQDFGTGEMQDLFDPAWATSVEVTASAAAAVHRDDPALLGYWSDNELHFGPDWRPLHLFDEYLAWPATAPGKQALIAFLQNPLRDLRRLRRRFHDDRHRLAQPRRSLDGDCLDAHRRRGDASGLGW